MRYEQSFRSAIPLDRARSDVLLTRSPLVSALRPATVRLACVRHAASVQSEPGSNSSVRSRLLGLGFLAEIPQACSTQGFPAFSERSSVSALPQACSHPGLSTRLRTPTLIGCVLLKITPARRRLRPAKPATLAQLSCENQHFSYFFSRSPLLVPFLALDHAPAPVAPSFWPGAVSVAWLVLRQGKIARHIRRIQPRCVATAASRASMNRPATSHPVCSGLSYLLKAGRAGDTDFGHAVADHIHPPPAPGPARLQFPGPVLTMGRRRLFRLWPGGPALHGLGECAPGKRVPVCCQ